MASPPAAGTPTIGVIMGSQSDWETMKAAADVLTQFGIAHECRVVSAHRTPAWMVEYARDAEARNLQAIIAGAGGAAHLPGMVASMTTVPVIGVPVATMAIGTAGATNAGLFAVGLLATHDPALRARLQAWRDARAEAVRQETLE